MLNKLFFLSLFIPVLLFGQFDDGYQPVTQVGGYGELHYNYSKPESGKAKEVLDFHRFVVFFSHSWNEKWSFKSEVELEHNFVSGGEGELELEQAYVDYHHAEWFGFRFGVVLPAVGLLNEVHEPPTFFGVERPDYHKVIIPTTWFGNGAVFYGRKSGFEYRFTVMEGLNGEKFSASSGIRSGRQKGYKANAENLLYSARLDYTGLIGLIFGGSFTMNSAPAASSNINVNLFEIHADYHFDNLFFRAEYGRIGFDNWEVNSASGFYTDLGYDFSDAVGLEFPVIAFARYSDLDPAAQIATGAAITPDQYHNQKSMIGAVLKPIPDIAFKIDFAVNKNKATNARMNLINFGVGYMF